MQTSLVKKGLLRQHAALQLATRVLAALHSICVAWRGGQVGLGGLVEG